MDHLRLALALLFCAALAAAPAACGGDEDGESAVEALPDSSCGELEYGGEGDPEVLIASDLPMQGDSAGRSEQMVEAIRLVLEREEWKAGDTSIAFQACDDSIAETGEWDAEQCRENARAYAENPAVIGVIGTYNSGCAAEVIPILNRAEGGGVAMVSPGNTLICLTQDSPTCDFEEPDIYYPTGERNYARVVPNDAAQGAALAQFAQDEGIDSPFVLFAAEDPVSQGQGDTFVGAAQALGMSLTGFDQWDPDAADYEDLMDRVQEASPDGIVLAGLLEQNGVKLLEDKVSALGSNEEIPVLAFDGFAQQATIDDGGEAATGMFASTPGRTPGSLKGPGKELVGQLREEFSGEPVELFAPYAGQAAEVLLLSIDDGGTDRAAVIESLFETRVTDGIVGSFRIGRSGDPRVNPISVSVAERMFELVGQVLPEQELIDAARGG